jgi:glycerol-3-phosphate acyltransferase PlsY
MALFLLLLAYLLGSLPFGYLIGRWRGLDIRRYGSGNIGATNVFRTLGLGPGLMVFILDLLKGSVAVWLMIGLNNDPWLVILAGGLAILGHTFSVFLKFKGGRGAATGLGVLLAVAPEIFFFTIIIVAIIIAATRYVSAGSILGAVIVALAFSLTGRPLPYTLLAWIVALLIIVRHIPNIKRLIAGTEPKIGEKHE